MVALGGLAVSAQASSILSLGAATGFNVFTLSDFSGAGTDAQGRVAVGGNFNPAGGGSFTVGSSLHDAGGIFDLVVGKNLTNNGTSFSSGSVWAGGDVNWSNASIANSLYSNGSFTGTSTTIGKFDVAGNFSSSNATISSTSFVGGSYTGSSANLNGGIVVGKNVSLNSITSGGNVYAAGVFTVGSGSVNGSVYSGTYSGPGYLNHAAWTSAPADAAVSAPIDFLAAGTQLLSVSSQLAGLAQNGTVTTPANSLTLTGTDATQNVFNITASQLSNALRSGSAGIIINAPAGSTVIINVSGTTQTISSSSITLNGVSNTQVLWNFPDATTINYSTVAWAGTLLAPVASFSGSGGNINGQIIANTISGNTEYHNNLFAGTITVPTAAAATPEPATLASVVGGLALIAIGLIGRKRRDRQQ
jgi:choice-of-anchor A domain-containing protein